MKNKLVVINSLKNLINKSPGFAKKDLSTYKLDILGLCGFGCRYCSSNKGNFLRISGRQFAAQAEAQLGYEVSPETHPELTYGYEDVVGQLERELSRKKSGYGRGHTLVFSMLTDGFSPHLVANGTTRAVLDLLLKKTAFRIRILTKNAIVGSDAWVQYFAAHRDRFVVGLSTGTLDADWATKVEIGTSNPQARLRALQALQDAGVPTYGMLCPVFPNVVTNGQLDALIDEVRPELCETIWAEPLNNRGNWLHVRDGYKPGSLEYEWFGEAFEAKTSAVWSDYAATLYLQLRERAIREGWSSKLKYMLYEDKVVAEDAHHYGDGLGLLLQSDTDHDGRTKNQAIREAQDAYAARLLAAPPEPIDCVMRAIPAQKCSQLQTQLYSCAA